MDDSPYEDAIDLLDADHKLVQQQFIDYQGLAEDGAPAEVRQQLADRIFMELTVHARLEEEDFYPHVGSAIDEPGLIDEALEEHAQAKQDIAELQAMSVDDEGFDEKMEALFKEVMTHVLHEREQVFLKARYSTLDLRGMAPALHKRKKQLMAQALRSAPARGVPA